MSEKTNEEKKEEKLLKKFTPNDIKASEKEKYNIIGENMNKVLEAENKISIPNPMVAMTIFEQGVRMAIKYLSENREEVKNSPDNRYWVEIGNYLKIGISYRSSEDEEKEGNYFIYTETLEGAKLDGKSDDSSEDE